jgi:hypothetical protein
MTKKDYEQLVRIIRRNSTTMKTERGSYASVLHERMFVQDLTLWLKHDNPRFDEEKFKKAVFK